MPLPLEGLVEAALANEDGLDTDSTFANLLIKISAD
jgi:hypothetical protein